MDRRRHALAAFFSIVSIVWAMAPSRADNWTERFHDPAAPGLDETATGVVAAWGGGWLAAGDAVTATTGRRNGLLVRYDARGQIAWQHDVGSLVPFRNHRLVDLARGWDVNYAAVGTIDDAPTHAYAIGFGEGPILSFAVDLGEGDLAGVAPVLVPLDHGFVAAGSRVGAAGDREARFVRLTPAGGIVPGWDLLLGTADDDWATSVAANPFDDGFVVAGQRRVVGVGYTRSWIAWIDATGALTDSIELAWAGGDCRINAISVSCDGGVLVAGDVPGRSWVTKITSGHAFAWAADKMIGLNENHAYDVVETVRGEVVVAGWFEPTRALVTELGPDGSFIFQSGMEGARGDSVATSHDGSIALVGPTVGGLPGDLLLAQLDSCGRAAGCPLINEAPLVVNITTTLTRPPVTVTPIFVTAAPTGDGLIGRAREPFMACVPSAAPQDWRQDYEDFFLRHALATSQGKILLAGVHANPNSVPVLLELDRDGNTLRQGALIGAAMGELSYVEAARNCGFLVGDSASTVVHLDPSWATVFAAKLNVTAVGTWLIRDAAQDAAGNVWVVGTGGTGEAFLVKLDSTGAFAGGRFWLDAGLEFVSVGGDGDPRAGGNLRYTDGQNHAWVVRLDGSTFATRYSGIVDSIPADYTWLESFESACPGGACEYTGAGYFGNTTDPSHPDPLYGAFLLRWRAEPVLPATIDLARYDRNALEVVFDWAQPLATGEVEVRATAEDLDSTFSRFDALHVSASNFVAQEKRIAYTATLQGSQHEMIASADGEHVVPVTRGVTTIGGIKSTELFHPYPGFSWNPGCGVADKPGVTHLVPPNLFMVVHEPPVTTRIATTVPSPAHVVPHVIPLTRRCE